MDIIHNDAHFKIRTYLDILNEPEEYGTVDERLMLKLLLDYKTKIASLESIASNLQKFNMDFTLNGDGKPNEKVSPTSNTLYEHILR